MDDECVLVSTLNSLVEFKTCKFCMSHVFDRPADFSALKAPKTGYPYTKETPQYMKERAKKQKLIIIRQSSIKRQASYSEDQCFTDVTINYNMTPLELIHLACTAPKVTSTPGDLSSTSSVF